MLQPDLKLLKIIIHEWKTVNEGLLNDNFYCQMILNLGVFCQQSILDLNIVYKSNSLNIYFY